MEDMLIMSGKERKRKVILSGVAEGALTLVEAAERLDVSYRQVKRIWRRYKGEGDKGLVHRGRGIVSHRRYPEPFKLEVLDLCRDRYEGFGPTLASECLLEERGLQVHPETLRLWFRADGLVYKRRRRKSYKQRREPRSQFGALIQIDGSIHAWFWLDGKHYCLINMVDDATKTTFSYLAGGETTEAVLIALKRWIERWGIPKAVYVDRKTVYVSPKRAQDEVFCRSSWSVFEQVCERLGIEIIVAKSAPAKGRVERSHGTYQDRFVKKMKLREIQDLEAANAYLESSFIDEYNSKYTRSPKNPQDAHRDPKVYGDLDQLICWTWARLVRNDWTFQLKGQHYQLERKQLTKIDPKHQIEVRRYLDGTLSAWFKGHRLNFHPIESRPPEVKVPTTGICSAQRSRSARQNKHKSPWNLYRPKQLVASSRKATK